MCKEEERCEWDFVFEYENDHEGEDGMDGTQVSYGSKVGEEQYGGEWKELDRA